MLEPLSDSVTSDSDISDGDKIPIEEIASPGKLLTPQAGENKETSDGESLSEESKDKRLDHTDRSKEDIGEDASALEDELKKKEKSAEEKVKPKSTATPPAVRQCKK